MTKGKGNKFRGNHSSNPQSSSNRGIEKRFRKDNKQDASRINLRAPSVPAIAPTYAFGHAYPNVPAFPSTLALNASRSWADVQGEKMVCRDQLSGYIFMCNGKTKADCYRYRVFGLPSARVDVVQKIKPQMKLFLYDFDLKLLHGIYIAASNGEMAIEPNAFGGKFSAQVRFDIFKDCLPLPESAFKQIIKDNYQGGSKFKQELTAEQVMNLLLLFRPIAMSPPRDIEPPGFEEWSRPAAELSASYDQYLAGRHFIQAGPKRHSQHIQQTGTPFAYGPHASVDAQPQVEPYYPLDAHQLYSHQNPALPPKDLHSRYAANVPTQNTIVPSQLSMSVHRHAHLPSSSTRTAAYWAAVAAEAMASEAAKDVYPTTTSHSLPSGSTGLGVPVTSEGAASTQLTVAENIDRELLMELGAANNNKHNPPAPATNNALVQAQATAPSQYQAPPIHEPVHLPSSSFMDTATNNIYNPSAAATNALVQAHATEPSQYQAPPLHEPTLVQAPMQSQAPPLDGSVPLPSPSLTAGYWASVAFKDPNQVYSYPYQWQTSATTSLGAEYVPISATEAGSAENPHAGPIYDYYNYYNYNTVLADTNNAVQAHDQVAFQPVVPFYGQTHAAPSSEAAAYWAAVPPQDTNQLSSGQYQIVESGNSSLGGENAAAATK